jgi:hypothetical protein
MTRATVLLISLVFVLPVARAQTTAAQTTAAQTTAVKPARTGLALLFGNSNYPGVYRLPTVEQDVTKMKVALESLGFETESIADVREPDDFEKDLRNFLHDKTASADDIILVYYSGHGIQIGGKAYLLGTAIAESSDVAGLRSKAEAVDKIVGMMDQEVPAYHVLIVDACRNAFSSAEEKYLKPSIGSEDTYVLFADQPGKTVPATSRESLQSPFTEGLIYSFETSDKGIEERFQIAKKKTAELNPGQVPQMEHGNLSAGRNKPFLDAGTQAKSTHEAGKVLNEAEEFYFDRNWTAYRRKMVEAKVLSTEPPLTMRLDREIDFTDHVTKALSAESDSAPAHWETAAKEWQLAAQMFPPRLWTLEKSALCRLLADQPKEAVEALGRLQLLIPAQPNSDPALGKRVEALTESLIQADPALKAFAQTAALASNNPAQSEFERYSAATTSDNR